MRKSNYPFPQDYFNLWYFKNSSQKYKKESDFSVVLLTCKTIEIQYNIIQYKTKQDNIIQSKTKQDNTSFIL